MRIHAIQTGTVAVKSRQPSGVGRSGKARLLRTMLDRNWTEPLPIFAWLIEHPEGLIVVDTGETSRVAEPGYWGWHPYFRFGLKEEVAAEDEIGPQLTKLGFDPLDVRWVVLTHFHTDHAGGLGHFPASEILVSDSELRAASRLRGRLNGYLPHRWPGWFNPTTVGFSDGAVQPFPASHPLTRAGDVVLVPTPGHTGGHLSVIVHEADQDVLLAGDTSYTQRLMMDGVVDGVAPDPAVAALTLRRIRKYLSERPTIYLPSHDPDSRSRLEMRMTASRPQPRPAVA
jgi:N-acyl homoserine lactone hydrolase